MSPTDRLPLIAAHPACTRPGSTCDAFVYLHDLFATILDAAGVSMPEAADGQSILAHILGHRTSIGRNSVYGYSMHGLPHSLRMVRTRTHKYVLTPSGQGQIHDLVSDPWEMRNLAGLDQARDAEEELMALLRTHMVRLGDPLLDYLDAIRRGY